LASLLDLAISFKPWTPAQEIKAPRVGETYNLTIGNQGSRLKFQPDHLEGVNAVSRLEVGKIWVHATPFAHSVLLPWHGVVQAWPAQLPSELTAEHFESILPFQPELVIFGSGERLRFISPALYRCLIEHRIGFETMDTAAACRTFNVLANEGRKVLGALLLKP
jgi:uncharacterized protein